MQELDKPDRNSGMNETPEEYIQEVTIGEHQPRNGPIHLTPYDPDWPSQFSSLEALVRQALGDKVLMLEHVGSTSVEGLSAKPIIDMVLVVSDSADEPSYIPQLEGKGFALHIREPDWHEHRLLKASGVKANLHVFSKGCDEVGRMLSFRDWLRSHPADKDLYEKTKRNLAARTWKYTQHYADAKTEVVEEILTRAMGP
ncbi:MAG: GrpB family protein [Anaerolineales bacterium]|jgi:GrpB-like predicted nucleotidyltransferase (UPF0157 family)